MHISLQRHKVTQISVDSISFDIKVTKKILYPQMPELIKNARRNHLPTQCSQLPYIFFPQLSLLSSRTLLYLFLKNKIK